jgi:hypothetical protein
MIIRRLHSDDRNDRSKQTSDGKIEALREWSQCEIVRDLQMNITTEIDAEMWSEIVYAGMARICRIRPSMAD